MLANLSLQRKLLLLLVVPLTTAFIFAILTLFQQWNRYAEASAVDTLVGAAIELDALRAELALEHGLSVAMLNGGGGPFLILLEEQQKQVDLRYEKIAMLVDGANLHEAFPAFQEQVRNLASGYQQLLQMRRAEATEQTLEAVSQFFNTELRELNDLLEGVGRRLRDPQNAPKLRSLRFLMDAEAAASRMRTAGVRVLLSREISQEDSLAYSVDSSALAQSLKRFYAQDDVELGLQSGLRADLAEADQTVILGLEQNILYNARKQRLLNELGRLIGYGGLIHDYKNYVLRGDVKYRENFHAKHEAIIGIVTQLQGLAGVPRRDQGLIGTVLQVFEQYGGNFELVDTLRSLDTEISLIDQQVAIDDTVAVEAMAELATFASDIVAMDWWEQSTMRVTALRGMAERVHRDLQRHARAAAEASLDVVWLNLLVLLALVGFSAVLSASIYRRTVGGINSAVTALQKIANTGDLQVPLPPSGEDEVGRLAAAVRQIIGALNAVVRQAEIIGEGDFSQEIRERTERDSLAIAFNRMVANTRDVVEKAGRIARGEYDIDINMRSEHDQLGQALTAMARELRDFEAGNQRENWVKEGRAQLARILSAAETKDGMLRDALAFLSEYTGAPASVYLQIKDKKLTWQAAYAASKADAGSYSVALGEGVLGEVARSGQPTLLNPVPEGFFRIGSALGATTAGAVLLVPVTESGKVLGVIEFAFLQQPVAETREMLQSIGEMVGVAVARADSQLQLASLLEAARNTADELRASEEELQAQSEELQAANEELRERSVELEERNQQIESAKAAVELKAREVEQASKYKSEFLANMSHELRTPLNSMLILSQMLAENEEGTLTEDQAESARIVHESGRNLLSLINDILDLAKVESGKVELHVEPMSLRELGERLQERYEPLAGQKGIELVVTIDPDVPETISSDSMRVEQVVTNLLSNALKFTEKGTVKVHVLPLSDEAQLPPGAERVPGMLAIEVTDSGIGIANDHLDKVFRAFEQADGSTTRKFGGTGLGLAISKEMAILLGGDIGVRSLEGKGSTFTLYLPPEAPEHGKQAQLRASAVPSLPPVSSAESGNEPQIQPQAPLAPLTPLPRPDDRDNLQEGDQCIVVVEDDPVFLGILMDVVRERGFKVIANIDGTSGIAAVERYQPIGVLLDLHLPGTDGWAVMEAIKGNPETRHIPVHFVSAEDQTVLAREQGAVGFSVKPVDRQELRGALSGFEELSSNRKRQVLVIEDDVDDQELVRETLDDDDLELTMVATGSEGLQLLTEQAYHCVVLDCRLPDMTGIEFLEEVVHRGLTLPPVIVHTGGAMEPAEEAKFRAFSDRIILKTADNSARLLDEATLFLHHIRRSTTEPPTSLLLRSIAIATSRSPRPYARSRSGSRVTWYCLTKPPKLATSDTPCTALSG